MKKSWIIILILFFFITTISSMKIQADLNDETEDSSLIAFNGYVDEQWDIFVVRPDGSALVNLTNHPANDQGPDWSPDGTKIVFISDRDCDKTFTFDIFVMEANGSNSVNLTQNCTNTGPDWSPDGNKIVFTSSREGSRSIYIMDVDGSNLTPLVNEPFNDSCPTWSPDGTKIAFCRELLYENFDIYVMDADGSNQTMITTSPHRDLDPAWSPDGTKIAFVSDRDSVGFDIFVMDSDGSNQVRLTDSLNEDRVPTWSPDGRHLVYDSQRGYAGLFSFDLITGTETAVTDETIHALTPSWSPELENSTLESCSGSPPTRLSQGMSAFVIYQSSRPGEICGFVMNRKVSGLAL